MISHFLLENPLEFWTPIYFKWFQFSSSRMCSNFNTHLLSSNMLLYSSLANILPMSYIYEILDQSVFEFITVQCLFSQSVQSYFLACNLLTNEKQGTKGSMDAIFIGCLFVQPQKKLSNSKVEIILNFSVNCVVKLW